MPLRLVSIVIVLAIAVLGVMAWKRDSAREGVSSEAPGASGEASGPAQMPPGEVATPPAQDPGIAWETPRRWVTELAEGMRLASYVIPAQGEKGGPAHCAVYYFGSGAGGGVEANIERWIGEFENHEKPIRRARTIQGFSVSQVAVTGDYATHAGSPDEGNPLRPGWSLLGAIVEGPAGTVFFKLTGPRAAVDAAAGEFDGLLRSLRKK